MMTQIKEILEKGGNPTMFTTYAVEIGDTLWSALWSYLDVNFPVCDDHCCGSQYRIEGIYEEEGQKFAILQSYTDSKYFRLDFSISETEGINFSAELVDVEKEFVPSETPQFDPAAVEAYSLEYAEKKKAEEKDEKDKEDEEEDVCPKCGKPKSECTCDEDEEEEEEGKKDKYILEEIQEYVELQAQYSALETTIAELQAENESLKETISSLETFKASVDREKKEEMIDSFYMLSDEDKKEVVENIDSYSLDDIEAKLSIICVRNKVSFALDEETPATEPVVVNLEQETVADSTPAWVRRALEVAKSKGI